MRKPNLEYLRKAFLVSAASIVIGLSLGCQKTVTVAEFDKSRFRSIEIGESVESVCEKAGLPLYAWVQYTGEQEKRLPRQIKPVTIEALKKAVQEPYSFTTLSYSKGANAYLDYVEYKLYFTGGKVQRKTEALVDP